jgi:hypothetical protein
MVDALIGHSSAAVATRKGPEPSTAKAGNALLKEIGYPGIVLQTDGEPSVKSWADAVQREWPKESKEIQTQLMTRTSPAGSH